MLYTPSLTTARLTEPDNGMNPPFTTAFTYKSRRENLAGISRYLCEDIVIRDMSEKDLDVTHHFTWLNRRQRLVRT